MELKRSASTEPMPEGKRSRVALESQASIVAEKLRIAPPHETLPVPVSTKGHVAVVPTMPASLQLVTGVPALQRTAGQQLAQEEVGIIGYIGEGTGFTGVIKQRFSDFIVREVDLKGEVVRLKEIDKPAEPKEPEKQIVPATIYTGDLEDRLQLQHDEWTEATTRRLKPYLSDDAIVQLFALYKEGKEPPEDEEMAANGQGRDRGKGRKTDTRRVLSQVGPVRAKANQPLADKEARAAGHTAVREALNGLFDSGTETIGAETRLTIKWAGGRGRGSWGNRPSTKHLPPYIHFTLQKTNRETQDAIGHISRLLSVPHKELQVAGTKDKRAITFQRVSLRRGRATLESVWKAANNIHKKGNTEASAVQKRGDRGCRIGDLEYATTALDLGHLQGNRFTIALRNVQEQDDQVINDTLGSLRDHGFINYYGMQRFGTSTMPTHLTGLHILKREWSQAIDSILGLREHEHPDVVRGRLAWLDDGDVVEALRLMPRRCVTERAIWEHWKKAGTTDKLGALTNIPRNMRTMYVHAYQSYIWNCIVSRRIKENATEPIVGDLVIVGQGEEGRPASSSTQQVKHLTADDLANHTIFDVVLPLPGYDVEYPQGEVGEFYASMLQADGLDIKYMRREQREYSLPGSYRKIVNRPGHLEWRICKYTDPNKPLTINDEDALLGMTLDLESDGIFKAVVLDLELGASTYATMALREVTREETASWWQTTLTVQGEDQAHRGAD